MTPISVNDKLPEWGQRVLLYDKGTHQWLLGHSRDPDIYKGEWFVELMPNWYSPYISHWLPLPDDPH